MRSNSCVGQTYDDPFSHQLYFTGVKVLATHRENTHTRMHASTYTHTPHKNDELVVTRLLQEHTCQRKADSDVVITY